jgi:hypothetical protein
MKSLFCLMFLLLPSVAFAIGYPVSSDVQRITPARCPIDDIPVINSHGAGGAGGAPIAVTTTAKVLSGLPNRQSYSFISDGDFCAEYGGSTADSAPTTEPVAAIPCTDGFLYKANILYAEYVFPGNRMDAACVSGTCNIYTVECNP